MPIHSSFLTYQGRMRDTPSLKILVSAIDLSTCQITLLDSIRGVFKTHSLISQKSSILEIRLCSKHTLNTELLLYRYGQSNKFRKLKSSIQEMASLYPKDVFLRSSRGCQIGTSPGWWNRILSGRPEIVGVGRPGDQYLLAGYILCSLWFPQVFKFLPTQ